MIVILLPVIMHLPSRWVGASSILRGDAQGTAACRILADAETWPMIYARVYLSKKLPEGTFEVSKFQC